MSSEKFDAKDLKPRSWLGVRHLQTLLLFLAILLAYGMRVNISMAIVAMTDKDNEQSFDWSMQTQSVILSSFFWGYIVLQIPAGELANRFGGDVLLTVSVGVNSAVSLLIPVAANYAGWQAVCACRVLQGLSQGFTYPSLNHLIGKWVPLEEKSRLGSIIYAGGQLGTALQLMASGFIAQYWGWPAIFYINGCLGAAWTVLYAFLGADSPHCSRMISDEEKLYIQTSLGHVGQPKKLKTPWRSVFTSVPFLVLIVVHSAQAWGFWTLMTEMPSYLKQVLGVDIKSNGVMSALPYLAMYLLTFPFGFLSDYALAKGYLSITATRKISNSIGMFGPAIALVGLSYSPAGDVTMAVALLTLVVGLNAGHLTGFMLVHIDMAPNFAGTLMGITNSVGNMVSIMAPLAAGLLLTDETDASEWRMVFYISSVIYAVGNLLYLIFGTSKRQEWNDFGGSEIGPLPCVGVRHLQTLLLFLALVLAYGMRVNMSIAIVAMTDRDNDQHFDWSMQTQSVILSSFFWGYIVLQIPAGELAARLGGSVLVAGSLAANAAVSMLIPSAAYYGGWMLVCACRVFQGLSQGFIVPAVHSLIGKWAPVEEKSRLGGFIHAGSQLGNAIQFLISGFIADSWGWPAIFYVNGVCGAIWTVLYMLVGADSPQTSKLISEEERFYIQTSLGQVGKQKVLKTPWKSIWTSLPFISLIVLHCSQNWGFWTLMTEMPSYMKQVLGVDIKANGVMTALPYLAMYLLSFPFAFLTDWLPNRGWLSVTATRKLSNSIGFFGPAVALVGLSYSPAGNTAAAVALLTLVVGLNVGHITGLMLVHIDMAPQFAGTLLGITNSAANVVSIIAPLVAGAVLKDETDPNEWRKVFYIASGVYFAGNLFYIIFGTSEKQKWNDPEPDIEGTENRKK